VLGLPESPGLVGGTLLVLGLLAAAACASFVLRRGRWRADWPLVVCAAVTLGAGPFLAWRIVEDVRYTTSLDAYERSAAGPIQAFLPGYLLDGVDRALPRDARYATVVGDSVPYETARTAFHALALTSLFPRVSVARPRPGDWIVAWGVDPSTVAPVTGSRVVRPRTGPLPPIRIARVRP
jgi:hypothetical protein